LGGFRRNGSPGLAMWRTNTTRARLNFLPRAPVQEASIVAALALSEMEVMRGKSDFLKLHCRDGSIGQWKHELGETHFEIFQRTWAAQLIQLGYSLV
jgi:hypothetical protein